MVEFWKRYEVEKKKLRELDLNPAEYENRLGDLLDRLDVREGSVCESTANTTMSKRLWTV